MPDILHRIGINAPAARVYAALTALEGVRGWWVSAATGDPSQGGNIDFGFCQMEVEAAVPGSLVRWRCTGGPDEWFGTTVTFQLVWREEQTFVVFSHEGWREPVEFMHHCSTKWAIFLLSLRELVETGAGRPAPHDLKIHVGD
jgi:uncharacterized protein YndB with AHSA1/START domain